MKERGKKTKRTDNERREKIKILEHEVKKMNRETYTEHELSGGGGSQSGLVSSVWYHTTALESSSIKFITLVHSTFMKPIHWFKSKGLRASAPLLLTA